MKNPNGPLQGLMRVYPVDNEPDSRTQHTTKLNSATMNVLLQMPKQQSHKTKAVK